MANYFNGNMLYFFKLKQWISLPDSTISLEGLKQGILSGEKQKVRELPTIAVVNL